MDTTVVYLGYVRIMDTESCIHSPPQVDRIWSIWESSYNIPKAIFYLLKGDYTLSRCCCPAYSTHPTHSTLAPATDPAPANHTHYHCIVILPSPLQQYVVGVRQLGVHLGGYL